MRRLVKYGLLELAADGDNLVRCSAQQETGIAQKALLSTQF
jgi:hypothetical protein